MKRILYLHAGAEMYGADKVLLELIKGLDSKEFEAHVILPNDGVLVEALRQVGAKVSVLDYPILRRKYFNPKGIADYIRSYNFYAKQIALYAREHSIEGDLLSIEIIRANIVGNAFRIKVFST